MVMIVSEIELNIVIFAGSRKVKTRLEPRLCKCI